MINSKNILTGYIILRGTALIHLPLVLIMLLLPRVHDGGLAIGIPRPQPDNTNFDGGHVWYTLAVTMHILLAFLHIFTFSEIPDQLKTVTTYMEGLKMLTILADVLNLIMAMNLFSRAPPYDELDKDD